MCRQLNNFELFFHTRNSIRSIVFQWHNQAQCEFVSIESSTLSSIEQGKFIAHCATPSF